MKRRQSLLGLGISFALFGISSFPTVSQLEQLNFNKQIDQTQKVPLETQPDPAIERAIRQKYTLYSQATYYYNRVDLNGDGQPEAIVNVIDGGLTGTSGFLTIIAQKIGQEYRLLEDIQGTGIPLIVTNQKSNGWNDLIMRPGHRSYEGRYYLMKFNGKTYRSDPTEGILLDTKAKMIGKSYFHNTPSASGFVINP